MRVFSRLLKDINIWRELPFFFAINALVLASFSISSNLTILFQSDEYLLNILNLFNRLVKSLQQIGCISRVEICRIEHSWVWIDVESLS